MNNKKCIVPGCGKPCGGKSGKARFCPDCARSRRNKSTAARYHRTQKAKGKQSRTFKLKPGSSPDNSPEAVADRLKFRKWMDNRKKEGKSDRRLSGKNEAKLSKYEPTYYDNLFYPTPEASPESRRSI